MNLIKNQVKSTDSAFLVKLEWPLGFDSPAFEFCEISYQYVFWRESCLARNGNVSVCVRKNPNLSAFLSQVRVRKIPLQVRYGYRVLYHVPPYGTWYTCAGRTGCNRRCDGLSLFVVSQKTETRTTSNSSTKTTTAIKSDELKESEDQ